MIIKVLIIGQAGRLRDGLGTVLRTFPGVADVLAVDSIDSALERLALEYPSVVIVDGDDRLENDCLLLSQMLSTHTEPRYIAITNTLRHRATAQKAGVDAVLLRGFSTTTLYNTFVSLGIIPDSGYIGVPSALNQPQTTTGPILQRI